MFYNVPFERCLFLIKNVLSFECDPTSALNSHLLWFGNNVNNYPLVFDSRSQSDAPTFFIVSFPGFFIKPNILYMNGRMATSTYLLNSWKFE